MGFSRENLKKRIFDFITENSEPFSSREMGDNFANVATGKMSLSPQRLGKYIQATRLVELNKSTKKWEKKEDV